MTFVRRPDESNNDALARCAEEVLAAGPMAATLRGDDYAAFLEGAFINGHTLRTRATSCGIFAGACSVHAGVTPRRPIPASAIATYVGMGNFGTSRAWIPREQLDADGGVKRGDVFYICSDAGQLTFGGKVYTWHRWPDALNGHVGICRADGWIVPTAEGGGSPGGTGCRLSAAPKDVRKMAHKLQGVMRPDLLARIEVSDTEPAPPPTLPTGTPRTLRLALPRMTGFDVEQLQMGLGIKADGIFGPATDAAVRAFQSQHGLDSDGVVGLKTWRQFAVSNPLPERP